MNLRDFSGKTITKIKDEFVENAEKAFGKNAEEIKQEFESEHKEDYEEIQDAYQKYSGMSEEDLTDELIRITNQQKANGTLDIEKIKSTYQMLYPMLNEEQKQKLEHLIEMIV